MYVDDHVDIFDMIDIDLFSVVALNMMVVQLDEGLYALACEEDVCCLATIVRSFKLIEVYIEHGVTALDSYQRPPPHVRATIEDITEPGSSAAIEHRSEKYLHLVRHLFVSSLHLGVCLMVIEDVMRQLSFEETELDGEAGFGDVAGTGIDSSGLSHDESFGVDDLDLNVSQTETQVELPVFEVPVFEESDVGRTQEHIIEQVIVEDYVSSEEDVEQGNG
ncbi:hypothetical protein Tco_1574645 [Tanacetum coccineum]